HQIIGGELKAAAACSLNEGQILVGELKHRDFCDVDFLIAGKCKKQIERSFETVDGNDQGLVRPNDRLELRPAVEIHFAHAITPISAARRFSAAATSKSIGACS